MVKEYCYERAYLPDYFLLYVNVNEIMTGLHAMPKCGFAICSRLCFVFKAKSYCDVEFLNWRAYFGQINAIFHNMSSAVHNACFVMEHHGSHASKTRRQTYWHKLTVTVYITSRQVSWRGFASIVAVIGVLQDNCIVLFISSRASMLWNVTIDFLVSSFLFVLFLIIIDVVGRFSHRLNGVRAKSLRYGWFLFGVIRDNNKHSI